ncbi:uncharacterized protein LOC123902486 isoform X2 [Trifolium pratense]|uniref:uncharacterized protein LOC123902486 isoform X2 n=1 Tax=Trifolium pratense TaxID=57577 RepID=UPI001E697B1E|nr:uncharacterized protein LOC123902486 isoform X2 [Trifolium pratense]
MCYFPHRFTLPSQFSVFIVCSGSQLEFDWQNDIPMIPKMLRKYEVLLFCLQIEIVYGSLPFDLEAGHKILPNIIPWNFRSELSTLIEKEVAKSMTIIENNSNWEGLANEELCIETDYLAILDGTSVVWLLCYQFSYVNILVANLLRCTILFFQFLVQLIQWNC